MDILRLLFGFIKIVKIFYNWIGILNNKIMPSVLMIYSQYVTILLITLGVIIIFMIIIIVVPILVNIIECMFDRFEYNPEQADD